MLSTVEVAGKRAGDATFLGQPRGLFYLAFTEAWERFSFYGMTALVVLYMVNQLLLPGDVEHIGGLSMSGGHIAMTFDQSFLLALLLLVVGSGFLKGNISAQVGALYPPEDELRR